MNGLKRKKIISLLSIVVLILTIVSITLIGTNDKYKGLVKVSNTGVKSKLAGSIGGATLEENTAKGNSTIEYIVSFTLDEIEGVEKRDALIKASLTEEEFKYARFKPINGSNIESTLKENGKEIEVLVKNVRLGQEKTIKLKLIIENAPNTVEIHPNLKVSESTGSYTTLETETITVETNSLEGQVKDEKDLPVGNIEVVVRKNGQEIKKAYTNENGYYVITDLETGTYELDVDEEIYEAKKETVEVNGRSEKNLRVKSVEPYKIETHKYITRLKLIIDGEEKEYTYEDKEKVLESIRRANTISGEIEYKLVVKNVGEKSGTISRVEDIASEGLKLKEGNRGWEEVEGTYYYRPLEGVTLKKNETREVGLVLEIESTSAAKTYINKMTTKGEIYEKVVYVLDGEVYKEEEVLEGEKIEEPIIGEDFSGWYTDKNRSNKYNFNNPVTKDLILYGVTEETKYTVRYIVDGEVFETLEVEKNEYAEELVGPDKEGKTFSHWSETENGEEFDFTTPITDNIDLYGVYELNKYSVTFMNGDEQFGQVQTVTHGSKASLPENTPEKEYYRFKYWSLEEDGREYNFNTSVTQNITLHAVYERIIYNVKFIDNGEIISDEDIFAGSIVIEIPVSKEGYTFLRWSESPNGPAYDFSKPLNGNLTLYSVYEINHYRVTFINEGTQYGEIQTVDYHNTVNRPEDPSKEYYRFKHWSLEENGTAYDFNTLVENDITLYSVYEIIKYNVKFIDDGVVIRDGEVSAGTIITPVADPAKEGYTFKHWSETENGQPYNFDTPLNNNLTLYSVYQINKYNVDFYNEGNKVKTVEVEYNSTVSNSDIPTVTKEGHTFTYWSLEGDTTAFEFSTPITHSIKLNSNFEIQKKAVTFNDENRIETVEVDWGQTVSPIQDKGKRGYTFSHWSLETGGAAFDFSTPITEPTILYAVYNIVTYHITYNLNGGIASSNPTEYTVETATFSLNNPEKEAYNFIGWTGTELENPTEVVAITKGSIGDREYSANYSAIEYTLNYNYNGGNLPSGETNPDKYTIESADITLNNPEKVGYTFVGWNDGEDTKNPYVIASGSKGVLNLTAVYEPVKYRIEYVLDGGSVTGNPEEYTIESNDITLNNPSKTGYNFIGWTEEGETEPVLQKTIPTGSTGNKKFTAHYNAIEYQITYELHGGSLPSGETNPDKYTIESADITIKNPGKAGYTFAGWNDGTVTKNPYVIASGSTGNINLEATYEINSYTVKFMDGETELSNLGQTVVYNTKATAPSSEENPTRTGYTFKYWSLEEGGSAYNFDTPVTNNIVLYSVYEINKYTVTFIDQDPNNPYAIEHIDYNQKATIPGNTPTKAHNIFKHWSLEENGSAYNFDTLITGDITLYSVYELVEAPRIDHTSKTWTKDSVTVTITSEHQDYTYYYNINGGQNVLYERPFPVTENCTINAYSVKNNILSEETSYEITNFDRINPDFISLESTGLTPVSATIKIKGQDNQSGLNTYKVYKNGVLIYTREAFTNNVTEVKEEEYTVTGLEEINDYTIKVELIDNVGNKSEETIEVTTPPKHYVARIISYDGTDLDESTYIKHESLKEALEDTHCMNVCTIQMIDDVEESNNVLSGQTITLDLNGHVVEGTTENTFNNNGTLQVIDTANEPGKIYSTGVGIYNTGTLTIGVNETPQEVSKTTPVVEGTTYGIDSNGTLNFYDGKIIGNVAVHGNIDDTPYLYNATVKDDTTLNKQVETLTQLAEAEARIRSTYYTKVQGGVDESKNGSYEDELKDGPLLSQLITPGENGFVYDVSTGKALNDNNNMNNKNGQTTPNNIAHSYFKLDLTNYTEPQLLTINAEINATGRYNDRNYGYIYITDSPDTPDLNSTDGRMFANTGSLGASDYQRIIENGSTYYVHFIFKNSYNDSSYQELFTINDARIGEYKQTYLSDLNNAALLHDTPYFFVKQEDGTYISNSNPSDWGYSDSYLIIDLTNVNEDKYILVDVSNSHSGYYGKSYISVTNNGNIPDYNSSVIQTVVSENSSVPMKTVLVKLNANEVNYVHFSSYGRYNYNKFTIHSMRNSEDNKSAVTDGELIDKDEYHFVKVNYSPVLWKDLSGNNNDGFIMGASENTEDNCFVFDGNDYVRMNRLSSNRLQEETVELEFSTTTTSNKVYYVGSNTQNIGIGTWDGYVIVSNQTSVATYNIPENLADGNKHKFTITYNSGVYNAYFDGTAMTKRGNNNSWGSDGYAYLGKRNTYGPNYYDGNIYSLKVYSRALSEDEISGTASSTGLLLYLNGSDYKKFGEYYINDNQNADNTTANSYLVFDLTGVSTDRTIKINATISSQQNGDIGYITVKDTPDFPEYNDTSGRYVYVSGESISDYNITLPANKVSYVHFGYRKDGSQSYNADSFIINSIVYYTDSDETVPTYIINNESNVREETYTVPVLNQEVDTVQILRDITLTNPLEIVPTRDVVLDLNGYTLTTSKDDYVIKNSGSLKIIDSKYIDDLAYSDADYNSNVLRYEQEYQRITSEAAEYTSNLQEQYDEEFDEEYQSYIARGGDPNAHTMNVESTDTNFTITNAAGYSNNPVSVVRSYGNTQTSVVYKETVNSSSYYSVTGTINTFDDYYPGDIGDVYIGFSTTDENRYDDFVTYEKYDIDTPSGKIYDYDIATPDEPGDYYFKMIVYHQSSPTAYTVGCSLNSITFNSKNPIRKNASEKNIENANNIYGISDYNNKNLLALFDGLTPGETENVWEDISGNGNNFNLQDVSYKDNGMYFNGSSSYATINTPIVTGNNETVELLIKPLNTNNQVIYLGDSSEKIEFGVYSGYIIVGTTRTNTFNLPSDYADGKIKHIAITYDNGDYEVYYNGTKLEKRSNLDYWGTLSNTRLGRDGGSGSIYNGYIYGIKIYDRTLKTDEIELNYNVDVARYNFNEFIQQHAIKIDATLTGNVSSTTNSVIFNNFDAKLDIESGIISLDKAGSYNVITNKGILTIGEYGILKGLKDSNRGIYNTESGDIIEGSGTIAMYSTNNIGILNDGVNENEIKGYKLENTSSNSKNVHNRSINDLVLNGITSNGQGLDVYQDTNNNLTIKNSTLNSTANESFYSNQSSVVSTITFDNSIINDRIYNRSGSYRKIIVKDSTMGGTRGSNIYNYDGEINITGSDLTHTEWNVENYGIVNISDSTFNANHHSITNGYDDYYSPCRGTMSMENTDIITVGTSNTNTIYNYGSMTIDGGSITNNNTNSTGVFSGSCYYKDNAPELIIKGDFSTNENYTTGVSINYGKLTIGDDEDAVSETNPVIRATNNAIVINPSKNTIPEFYYYDGKIVGKVNESINGHITDVPDNYDLYVTKGETSESVVLKPIDFEPSGDEYVARIGDTKYVTLQGAINAVPNNVETEIVLLKDIEAANTIDVNENKIININMDNHYIKLYNEETGFINEGVLNIYNGELNDDAYIIGYSKKLMVNNGTLTYDMIKSYQLKTYQNLIDNNGILNIDNSNVYTSIGYDSNMTTEIINNKGTMTITDSDIYSSSTQIIRNSGTMTMNNGKLMTTAWISSGGYTKDILITNEATGLVTLNDVYYEKEDGNYNIGGLENYGTIYVNGGRADLKDYLSNNGNRYPSLFAYNRENGNIYITDMTIVSSRGFIVKNSGYAKIDNITSDCWNGFENYGTMEIEDSTIQTVNSGTSSNSGTLTVTNSTIKGDPTALSSSGNLTVTDSSIISTRSPGTYDDRISALSISDSGTTNVTGSTLTGKYGIISSSSGTTTLDDNIITGNSQNGIQFTGDGTLNIKETTIDGVLNGIYNTGAGTINIGVSDGTVSKSTPSIKGNNGLNNTNVNASINMYDGVLIGTTALNGALANIESGYSLILETIDDLEYKYLDKVYTVENITSPNHEQYYSIQEGIDNASNGDTLKLLRELTITNSEPSITVDSSKEVTLDLDGYKISAANTILFENDGNLTITSSKVDETTGDIIPGYIESAGSKVIDNSNNITLTNLDIKKISNNSTDIIYNSGTMTNNNIKVYTGIDGMSSWLIYNDGTLISNDSHYLTYNTKIIYNTGTITSISDEIKVTKEDHYDCKINMIYNESTGIITFTDIDFRHMSRYYPGNTDSYLYYGIVNYGEVNLNGGTVREDGSRGYWGDVHASLFLENKLNAVANIDGTSFVGSNGIIAHNYGAIDINNITSSFDSAIMNYSGGTATITNSNLTSISRYSLENNGTLTIDNTSITSSGTTITNTADATITNSTLTSTSTSSSANNISNSGTGTLTIDQNTSIIGQIGIGSTGTGNINILSADINTNYYGINNSGAGTITLGVHADGTVSKTNPSIKGNSIGLNNTNNNAVINFYDGLLIGNTSHSGAITNLEDNYEIISETIDGLENEYLDRTYVMQNISSATQDKYYTIQEAVDDASIGDTLLLLRKASVLPSESAITVGSNKEITIDLNGYIITTNNSLFLTNNGKLTITDNTKTTDSVGTGGITSNISQIFANAGTLTIEGGTYLKTLDYTNSLLVNSGKVVINNGKLTMGQEKFPAILIETSNELEINGGEISTFVSTAIHNTGILKITDGLIKKYSDTTYFYPNDYMFDPVISSSSTGVVTVTGGTFEGREYNRGNTNEQGGVIFSDGLLTITGGTFIQRGDTSWSSRHVGSAVRNGVNGTATITGGTYNSELSGIIYNQGTAIVENITSSYEAIAYNSGTLKLDNCTFNNVINYVINNNNINSGGLINTGDLTIIGGSYTGSTLIINNYGDMDISGTTIQGSSGINNAGTGTTTISNLGITASGTAIGVSDSNDVTVDTVTIVAATTVSSSGGNIELNNVTSNNTGTIFSNTGTGTITINDGTHTTTSGNILNNTSTGKTIIKTGLYTTSNGDAINNTSTGTIEIGELGGTPSITDPYILGTGYGINNQNNNSNIYFYDGIISGQTGSIYGTIRDVEPGYKEVRNPNTIDDIQYTSSTLAPLGDEDVVVVVNNTNFASVQSAVNYAVANEIAVISLKKDFTLEADLIKPVGINVTIYTNGHTLNTGGYTVDSGITIDNGQAPSGLGGAIYQLYASITGSELNPKNIVIYHMEDGTILESNKTYKLYKLENGNYNIVKFVEEGIGEYNQGGSSEKLSVINGRLYLNVLGQGQYKLVGSDNKELDFSIYENSVSDNIRISNRVISQRTNESIAMVILTFSTGVLRSHYILLILLLTIILLSLMAIRKTRKELE